MGAANTGSKVCAVDAALTRTDELPRATTVMSSGASASVNGTVIVAVVPLTDVVAPDITEPSAFLTSTPVTPEATAYVILALYDPALNVVYTGSLAFTGAANCFSHVCDADAALPRPAALAMAITTILTGESASVNGTVIVAVVPLTTMFEKT